MRADRDLQYVGGYHAAPGLHHRLEREWSTGSRGRHYGSYTAADVYRLRGSIDITLVARYGAARLWDLLHDEPYLAVLSAITGNQPSSKCRPDERLREAAGR